MHRGFEGVHGDALTLPRLMPWVPPSPALRGEGAERSEAGEGLLRGASRPRAAKTLSYACLASAGRPRCSSITSGLALARDCSLPRLLPVLSVAAASASEAG